MENLLPTCIEAFNAHRFWILPLLLICLTAAAAVRLILDMQEEIDE